ncbi:MAG: carboxylating nicotinate-nucleotide diphosphorylase [Paludibacteraceae bacterium]|nr:carboxylating nicotinate-nucleotide diphosphorylase [Paludibacteraceae bacterium]
MTLKEQIRLWFAEDIGDGDHSTLSCIPADAQGSQQLIVKQPGIIAGIEVAKQIFSFFDSSLRITQFLNDGDRVRVGDVAFRVDGSTRSLLQTERLMLNVMQRMSGIATRTAEYVELLRGTNTRILDTRKTTPGIRLLEKMAVRIGGGDNHRFGLFDMVMLKDNHVDHAGGITQAIDRCHEYLKANNRDLRIEIEVRNLDELRQVLSHGGVHRIMLDNFTPDLTRQAVRLIDHRYEVESSGGITRETIRAYAECGVDFISVGALTHHVSSLDLSFKAVR